MSRTTVPADTKRIFISYRRDDTSGYAARLYADLTEVFEEHSVFRDVVKIAPGRDFLNVIDEALASCVAMVVVIGAEWSRCTDATGRRRLDDPDDVLRREVTAALERKSFVIPVLVEGARMPRRDDLPEGLRGLAAKQALELTDTHWDQDVARLVNTIESAPGAPRRKRGQRTGRWRNRIGIALAAGLAITLLGLWLIARRSSPPERMSSWFNIALADFGQIDARGRVTGSTAASDLSTQLNKEVTSKIRPLEGGGEIQLRAIGRLQGATPEERAASAERRAEELNADVVLFGVLQSDTNESVVTPEIYISDRHLLDAGEVVGHHQLGSPVRAPGEANRGKVRRALVEQLLPRSQPLAETIAALGDYSLDRYEGALAHLQAAEGLWGERDGKEVLYLLLGNVAGKLGRLDEAEANYAKALEQSPEYSRANLGKAEVIYHRSRGTCEAGDVDGEGLMRSLNTYAAARTGPVPAGAEVPMKAAFGEGRVLLCLSQAGMSDRWTLAEERFNEVIGAFGGTNERLRDLAAEAHANLGFIYRPADPGEPGAADKYEDAAREYETAIRLYEERKRRRDRQAIFQSVLVFLFDRLQDRTRSERAYAECVRLSEQAADDAASRKARPHVSGGAPSSLTTTSTIVRCSASTTP